LKKLYPALLIASFVPENINNRGSDKKTGAQLQTHGLEHLKFTLSCSEIFGYLRKFMVRSI
jgi:hypothetical protein